MCSTRNTILAALVASASIVGGCQSKAPPVANTMNGSTLIVDGAMQKRDWDVSHVMYQNGTVRSPADRFLYQATDSANANTRGLVETPLFVANIIVLPFTFFNQPPGELVNSATAGTPESYTAMPNIEAEEPSEAGHQSNTLSIPSHSGAGGRAVGGGGSGVAP